MKRGLLVVIILLAVGLAVFLTRQRDAPPASARPNVLLITIDTLRADRVGGRLTPNINRIAARGASFSNVRATAPLTLPSHVSIMTGTIPPVHGVRENGQVFDRKTPTLARIFKDAGYGTAAFVGAYVLNRRFGLDEGFDTYDDAVRRDMARAEQLEAERPGGEVVEAALKWLQASGFGLQASGSGLQPFFLWVHMYDPHAPYAPAREFLEKAGGNAYDGEVMYADAQVGRLVDALESMGLLENTIVAITGDHGESLGEHGEQTHGMLLYEAALRVPVVAVVPGTEQGPDGRAMTLTELAPGLLMSAGLTLPQGMCGRSLGYRPGDPVAQTIQCDSYAESLYPRRAGWHALKSLSDDHWKLIASSETELYDLRKDPAERQNIAAANAGVAQGMSAAIARLTSNERSASAVPADAAERLRALGYVSGSAAVPSDDPQAPNPAKMIGAWTEFERALGLLQSNQPREALAILKPLAATHPGAPVFQSTYAQALRDAGDPKGALDVYKAAVAKWPNDPALFHDLAAAAREAGEPGEAMRAEQAALALDGNSAMAFNGMGLLHVDAGRSAEAVAAFERATRQDPTNASYWTNLGNARGAGDDGRGAEAAYRQALDVDPRFADALNGLGVLYVRNGRASEAVPLLERAVTEDPQLWEARLNLGIALQESGQTERASAAYRELLAAAPPSAKRERQAAEELLKALRGTSA